LRRYHFEAFAAQAAKWQKRVASASNTLDIFTPLACKRFIPKCSMSFAIHFLRVCQDGFLYKFETLK
jgi:hypothetical protein